MLMVETAATEWQKAWPSGIFTVLAALLASWFAFRGVLKGLEAHAKRERDNRETEIRRQVFLDASEAISLAADCLGAVPNYNVSDPELRLMVKDFQVKTGKLEFVAELQTIAAFFAFRREFHKITQALSPLRGEMMDLKRKLDASKELVEQLRTEFLKGGVAKEHLDGLANAEKQLLKEIVETAGQIKNISLQLHARLQEFSDSFAVAQLEFFYCARQEFGFGVNKEEYLRLTREDAKAHTELILSAISEVTGKSTEPKQTKQDIASG